MRKAVVFLLILASPSALADRRDLRGRGRTLMDAPLLSSFTDSVSRQDGTFSRASASTCRVGEAASPSSLGSGASCQDSSYGVRVGRVVENLAINPNAIDSWTANSTTVTADYEGSADRVQMNATGDYVRDGDGTGACSNSAPIVISAMMKSLSGNCTIWLGNAYGAGFPGTLSLVNVTTEWSRVQARTVSDYKGDCHSLIYRYNASASCFDILVKDVQLEETPHAGPGQYCPSSCNAEDVSIDEGMLIEDHGTLTFDVTFGDMATWDIVDDAMLLSVEASSTWSVQYDATIDEIVFTAGGQTVRIDASGARWTTHEVGVSWRHGSPILLWYDDENPSASSGNYVSPAFTGPVYVGSSVTSDSQLDAFYSNLAIESQYSSVEIVDSLYANDFDGDLAPETGTTTPVFSRATAWTCLDSGGAGMSALAVNEPCYVVPSEDSAGPDGDAGGVRVFSAAVNRVAKLSGTVGNTPAGWTSAGAGSPVVTETSPFWGSQAASYSESATNAQFIYDGSGSNFAVGCMSYYLKTQSAQSGMMYLYNASKGATIQSGSNGYSLVSYCDEKASDVNGFLGASSALLRAPSAGTFTFDAPMSIADVLFPHPYCDGATPPVACGAEQLTAALTAEEFPLSGELHVSVAPAWASDEAGIDRYVFDGGTDFELYWDESAKSWTFECGGQTAVVSSGRFERHSYHEISASYGDGVPISLTVDGVTDGSAGTATGTARDATVYLGSSSVGGDECACMLRDFEIR